MVKKRIDIPNEVTKIWQEARENLRALGQKTMRLAKKGEKEVVRASQIGKLQLDVVSLNLKKENFFRQAGKRAYEMQLKKSGVDPSKLTSLFNQITKLDRQIKTKKSKVAKLKRV